MMQRVKFQNSLLEVFIWFKAIEASKTFSCNFFSECSIEGVYCVSTIHTILERVGGQIVPWDSNL